MAWTKARLTALPILNCVLFSRSLYLRSCRQKLLYFVHQRKLCAGRVQCPNYPHLSSSDSPGKPTKMMQQNRQYCVKNSKDTENHANAYPDIDISFEDAEEAYRSKSSWDIFRALIVFNLCSIKPLVEANKQLMKASRKIFGKHLFVKLMRGTFYGQFVAGENQDEIMPVVEKNRKYGVKSILDYSVEKDISREEAQSHEMKSCTPEEEATSEMSKLTRFQAHKQFGDRREDVFAARTYFYEDESVCNENMNHFHEGISAVSGTTDSTGFAAIKLTALGRPQLLLQMSEVLTRVHGFFDIIATKTPENKRKIFRQDFENYLKMSQIGREERRQWFDIMDMTGDGMIDSLEWQNILEVNMKLVKLLTLPNLKTNKMEPIGAPLTHIEQEQMKNMIDRITSLLDFADSKDVRVMVDAEQTYFQVAINRLCVEMMRKYNKNRALVFNTYQCYLKDTFHVLNADLRLSRRENFYFGAKLVRGAYMDQERKRAATLNYEDPINPNYEATTRQYHTCLEKVLQEAVERQRKVAIMVASHNEETVRFTVEQMKNFGIQIQDRVVCFGQLLGMCDQVSFSLGQAGYSVYKYVPYGPVEEVLPYLSRRAYENGSILEKLKKEKRLLRTEFFRRIRSGQMLRTIS